MGPSPGVGAHCVHLCAPASQPQSPRVQTCQKHLLLENMSFTPSSVTPALLLQDPPVQQASWCHFQILDAQGLPC